jgi:hypothetical protein
LIVVSRVDDRAQSPKEGSGGFAHLSELLTHLDRNGGNATVVVALKPPEGRSVASADETERLAKELIGRAEKATGRHVASTNVFRRFGRFVIDAPAEIIRHVVTEPEVQEVTPNEIRGSGLIDPVRRGPADGW